MNLPLTTSAGSQTTKGLMLGIAGFILLAVGDGLVKSTAGQWPGIAVAALRYVFGMLGLCAIIAVNRGQAGFRVARPGLQLARGVTVAVVTLGFFSAVQLMPLADATAIQFTGPIFAALFSWLLLGERAPATVWLTTCVAIAGVAMVLRPNVMALGPAALFPVMAAAGMGLLMVLNRLAGETGDAVALQFWLAAAAIPPLLLGVAIGDTSGVSSMHVSIPAMSVVLKCATVAITGTLAHWLIFVATRFAPAPVVAPAVYVQLVLAVVIGWVVFGNRVDLLGGAGMAMIIGSSLLLWYSQRRAAALADLAR